ncbi:MAG: secondary thiamine-phosphate synthase enzyme YjbQ [Thermodesulfobacteriota bacterium]
MAEIRVRTSKKYQVLDLTAQIAQAVRDSRVSEGICCVYTPHATAAIVINENDDPQIGLDLLDALEKLIPEGVWRHDQVDSNGAAHLKAAILGPSEVIPVQQSRLALGTWQAIMLVELDGPRDRRVIVTIQ